MIRASSIAASLLLLVLQIVLCNFIDLSQYFTLSFLPVIILCLPLQYGPISCMLIAFVIGFISDFFYGGVLGLSCVALLPVALLRRPVIRLFTDHDLFSRLFYVSYDKMGSFRVGLCNLVLLVIFFIIYIWIDGAQTRSFSFNLLRLLLSLIGNMALSMIAVSIINSQKEN